jgi:hypothetical protein
VRILRGLDGKEDPSARPPRRTRSGFASLAGCPVRILKKLKGSGCQIETGAKPGTRD